MHRRFILIISVFAIATLSPLLCSAVTFEAINGPPGGSISQLTPDRKNPQLWFAVNDSIVYRSVDYGKSWTRKLSKKQNILVHPVTSEVLVFSGYPSASLWESQNFGESFSLRGEISISFFQRAFWDPERTNTLYALGIGGDFNYWDIGKSTDGGRTWKAFQNLPYKIGQDIGGALSGCKAVEYSHSDLLFAPGNSNTLYVSSHLLYECASNHQGFIFVLIQTTNGGNSWKVLENNEYAFASDPLYPERAFAFNDSGIKIVTASGLRKVSALRTAAIVSVPGKPNDLIALKVTTVNNPPYSKRELVRSTDLGATWQFYSDNIHEVNILQSVDDGQEGLLAGTGAGVYYRNSESDWAVSNSGFHPGDIWAIDSSRDGSILYATNGGFAGSTDFLYKSTDSGKSWTELNFTPGHPFVITSAIAVDPQNPNRVFLNQPFGSAEDGGFTMVTTDGGENWKVKAKDRFFRTFDPQNSNVLYFASTKKIFKSINSGTTFKSLPTEFNSFLAPYVVVDPFDSNTLFFLTTANLFRSNDGGKTRAIVSSGILKSCADCNPRPNDMAPLPQRGGFLLITGDGRIYRTYNSGNTWQLLSRVSNRSGLRDRIFAAGPQGSHFYVIRNSFLFESLNGGRTWSNITKKLGYRVNAMTDPRFHPFFVATTRGIYKEIVP